MSIVRCAVIGGPSSAVKTGNNDVKGTSWSVVSAAGGADVVVLGAADSVFGMKEAAAGL